MVRLGQDIPTFCSIAREIFETPHDCRPKRMLMLTAYLDETGHEGKDLVILAGFVGTEDQWKKCEADWRVGLGKRKHLHMQNLRWSKPERLKPLLSRLGPIPHDAGLQAVYSSAKVADYADLVDGTTMQKLLKGYLICLQGIIDVLAKHIPNTETFKLVLEAQDTYEMAAHSIYRASDYRTPDGRRKLVSLEFIEKDESVLAEPADYLAYALLQQYRNPKSVKSALCASILKMQRPGFARDHVQQKDNLLLFVKGMIERHPKLMRSLD